MFGPVIIEEIQPLKHRFDDSFKPQMCVYASA